MKIIESYIQKICGSFIYTYNKKMDGMFAAALRLLDKIEDLNPDFEGYLFMKKYWLANTNREFFKKNFPEIKLPKEYKYQDPENFSLWYRQLSNKD